MIEQKMYCDRCGRLCSNYINNRGFNLFRNKFVIKTNKSEYLDLCQDCYDSLAEWMKEGESKDSSN